MTNRLKAFVKLFIEQGICKLCHHSKWCHKYDITEENETNVCLQYVFPHPGEIDVCGCETFKRSWWRIYAN